jgi:hypothetical protein
LAWAIRIIAALSFVSGAGRRATHPQRGAHLNSLAASPPFNYGFRRQDDFVKFGFTVALNVPAPAAAELSDQGACVEAEQFNYKLLVPRGGIEPPTP